MVTRALSFALLGLICSLGVPSFAWAGGDKESAPSDRRQNIFKAGFQIDAPAGPYDVHIEQVTGDTADGVDFRLLALPGVRNGSLETYYFVSIRLVVADGRNVWNARESSHVLRDAIIRRSHAALLMTDDPVGRLDPLLAETVILEAAASVLGEGYCDDVIFFSIEQQV